MQRIATGVWGGQHINVEVGEKSAAIEYDCANGVIDGPLVVDSNGQFQVARNTSNGARRAGASGRQAKSSTPRLTPVRSRATR